jgi:hypothetical protein
MLRKAITLALLALTLHACGGPDDGQPGDEATAVQDAAAGDAADARPAACGSVTWKNYAGAFFKSRCAACHAQAFSTLAKVKASGARAQLAAGTMPRGTKLDPATKKKILAWFTCGSP